MKQGPRTRDKNREAEHEPNRRKKNTGDVEQRIKPEHRGRKAGETEEKPRKRKPHTQQKPRPKFERRSQHRPLFFITRTEEPGEKLKKRNRRKASATEEKTEAKPREKKKTREEGPENQSKKTEENRRKIQGKTRAG